MGQLRSGDWEFELRVPYMVTALTLILATCLEILSGFTGWGWPIYNLTGAGFLVYLYRVCRDEQQQRNEERRKYLEADAERELERRRLEAYIQRPLSFKPRPPDNVSFLG
jgi:hypothetical protein